MPLVCLKFLDAAWIHEPVSTADRTNVHSCLSRTKTSKHTPDLDRSPCPIQPCALTSALPTKPSCKSRLFSKIMSDRSSSPELEPLVVSNKTAKSSKDKSKKKDKTAQPAVVQTPHGKNEGTNTEWAYKPPEGTVVVDGEIDEDFDWESLKDSEDLELWIVRVTEGVRAVHTNYHVHGVRAMHVSRLSRNTCKILSWTRRH